MKLIIKKYVFGIMKYCLEIERQIVDKLTMIGTYILSRIALRNASIGLCRWKQTVKQVLLAYLMKKSEFK